MSSSEPIFELDLQSLKVAAVNLEHCALDPHAASALDAETLQRILAGALRVYVRRIETGEALDALPPEGTEFAPTPTDVMVGVTQLLAATGIELFELGMWQTWGSARLGPLEGAEND